MIAKIAVSAAVYAIDKLYSYYFDEQMPLEPGMRVIVPFGRGNRPCEGIVLQTESGSEEKLKSIQSVLDAQPVLTERQLRMAAWICQRYFCTFYEACRAILPAGLWFRATDVYAINREAGDWHALACRNEAALRVMQILEDLGGSAEHPALKEQMGDEQELDAALRYLLSKKLITTNLDMTQRVRSKTEKTVSLCVPAEQAAAFAEQKKRSAPLQKSVLDLLCVVGSGALKEICYLTGASAATVRRLQTLGYVEIAEREILRTPIAKPDSIVPPPELTHEQRTVCEGLFAQMQKDDPGTALLYGVTGSGKTAVYVHLLQNALDCGKTGLLLVPEIALTPQLLERLCRHFGKNVAVLHSSLRVGERYDEWRRIRSGEARIIIGTRSAVFAPTEHLGVIIVDEEHEHTYKSENAPRYHAREVAIYRGVQEKALVVLGSATPSVESMYLAKSGAYSLYTLRSRYNGRAMPVVTLVDMKQELRRGNPSAISAELEERLRDNILDGRQSILFLNRRGSSRCLVCVECGEAPGCPACSVSLTYHSANNRLMCHYCGYSQALPKRCTQCGGPLKPVGFGTQKIEQELHSIFPDTALIRMDADTLSAANNHEAILNRFRKERIPILLGTQMVAKGLDFENVTLVGVVDADMSLYVDYFRAAETTFSLITQVVGRAGRGEREGLALIQTMTPEHPVLQMAARQDYDSFYDMEIALRTLRRFPPVSDIFFVTVMGIHEDQVMRGAMRLRDALRQSLQKSEDLPDAVLLGPSPAPVARVNYTYRYRLTLNCKNSRTLRQLLAYHLRAFAKDPQNKGLTAYADINSYD